ncbi:MAG: rane protein, partial [Proteobacteria bacterium]|nr:rane protein [Pseudomonadota bacterium]
MEATVNFIDLNVLDVTYLLVVGFIGGLVSGFIGSGGAFVLTPAMMSMGVPAIVAVASNICHKFPKALVGAIKRAKYGQVDVKLGLVLGVSAEAGVLYGAHIQEGIKRSFGDAGSNLYVSLAFVVVLGVVGGYVLWDVWKTHRSGQGDAEEKTSRLALWVQSIEIPGTMVYFKSLNTRLSVLFTIPIGFATGMLAATIAVGGFIGVPALHYVLGAPSLMASATELVIAFVMGLGGTIKFGWSGLVDIRLAMIILAGSLFGIQLGAIGTTYVKPSMIKVVMGVIMVLVLLSRAIEIPVYLAQLDIIQPLDPHLAALLKNLSFVVLIAALASGAAIVFAALWRGVGAHRRELAAAATAQAAFMPAAVAAPAQSQLSPLGRFERFLVATDGSEYSAGAVREALRMASRCGARLRVITIVSADVEHEATVGQLLKQELNTAHAHLAQVQELANTAGVACETEVLHASNPDMAIVHAAEQAKADLVVMGRRGRRGLARLMLGDITARVIGSAPCNVLVVPRAAELLGKHFVVATDGSRFGDAAAVTAGKLARLYGTPVTVVSVT